MFVSGISRHVYAYGQYRTKGKHALGLGFRGLRRV